MIDWKLKKVQDIDHYLNVKAVFIQHLTEFQ